MRVRPVKSVLTVQEFAAGSCCGVDRNIASIDRPGAYGYPKEYGWEDHIEGACGEVAAAKTFRRFWSPTVNTFKEPDIQPNIQVRTRRLHYWDVIVRPEDDPDHLFVLVTGKAPNFWIRGYILGRDARRDEWFKTYDERPKAWFPPQNALRDWRELVAKDQLELEREAA